MQRLEIFDNDRANVGFLSVRLEHKPSPDLWEGQACDLAWFQQVRYQDGYHEEHHEDSEPVTAWCLPTKSGRPEFPQVGGVARATVVHNLEAHGCLYTVDAMDSQKNTQRADVVQDPADVWYIALTDIEEPRHRLLVELFSFWLSN